MEMNGEYTRAIYHLAARPRCINATLDKFWPRLNETSARNRNRNRDYLIVFARSSLLTPREKKYVLSYRKIADNRGSDKEMKKNQSRE